MVSPVLALSPTKSTVLRIIILDADTTQNASNAPKIWRPEDILSGNIQIMCTATDVPVLEEITVFFEGVVRNWIDDEQAVPNIFKAERKFLSQAQDISLENISKSQALSGSIVIFEASFHFIISRMIARFDPESPEQCLSLPPSLELGDKIVDLTTGDHFAQPLIAYSLRAVVTLKPAASDITQSLETLLPIEVIPHIEELPPTYTEDFPSEFKEHELRVLRRGLLGTSRGTMSISLGEPEPLAYDNESLSSTTKGLLRFTFVSGIAAVDALTMLNSLKFTVLSLVRAKTFYSVKSFSGPPSQSSLRTQKHARLRDDILKLETHNVTKASWGYRFDLANDFNDAVEAPEGFEIATPVLEPVEPDNYLKRSGSNGRWISYWTIPIHIDGRLLPTFCSAMVSRCYSLIVRVKLSGVHKEVFDLEVPLQVIHTSPRASQYNADPQGRESFLEPRRRSESSWFSDESLETDLGPPRYYA